LECGEVLAGNAFDRETTIGGLAPEARCRHRAIRESNGRRHVKPQGIIVPNGFA